METANGIRQWRKSSYSGANGGDCVEVGTGPDVIAVRDTTDRSGPVLRVSPDTWAKFTTKVRSDAR
jgi:Domain of unknown function (DUF397)